MTAKFDRAQIERHCSILHTAAENAQVKDGKLALCVYGENPDTREKTHAVVQHFAIGDVAGMVNAAMQFDGQSHANVYTLLAVLKPETPDGSRKAVDIAKVLALVIDGDADKGKAAPVPPIAASYVIQSSQGNVQHVYWLDTALEPDDAKQIGYAIQRATGAECAGDIAHVWRVPGCLNWPNAAKIKRGRPRDPQPVTILQDCTAWSSADKLREALATYMQPRRHSEPTAPRCDRNTDPAKARAFHERLRDAGHYDAGPDARTRYIRAAKALSYDLGDEGRKIWEDIICWRGARSDEGEPVDATEADERWADCSSLREGARPITHGTLIDDARKLYGWSGEALHLERQKTAAEIFDGVIPTLPPGAAPLVPGLPPCPVLMAPMPMLQGAAMQTKHLARYLDAVPRAERTAAHPLMPDTGHALRHAINDAIPGIIATGDVDGLATVLIVHEPTAIVVGGITPQVRARAAALSEEILRECHGPDKWSTDVKTGRIESDNPDNLRFFLTGLKIEVRFNAWTENVELRGWKWREWTKLTDDMDAALITRASQTKTRFVMSETFCRRTLIALAHDNTVDPALDLLDKWQRGWDGVPRIDMWLCKACGVPDDAYHRAASRVVLLGIVGRIRVPGIKFDLMPVMVGEKQGEGKSTLANVLAIKDEWFTDEIKLGDEGKELVLSLAGIAVAEVPEMRTRGDINAVKAMITRRKDRGRPAYGRSVVDRPRRNILFGNTNHTEFLEDEKNRRFLPIEIPREIDLAWMRENLPQLIGEAAAAFDPKSRKIELPREVWATAAEHQEKHRIKSDMEVQLAEWFGGEVEAYITAGDLGELARIAGWPKNNSTRSPIMRKLGFREERPDINGIRTRVWVRGSMGDIPRYRVGSNGTGSPRLVLRTDTAIEGAVVTTPPALPPPRGQAMVLPGGHVAPVVSGAA